MNQPYDRYKATINGHTYKQEFRFHELRPINKTFKNVTWTMVGQEESK